MKELSGKIAVVTGASRGVGRRIALRLAKNGAAVAAIARSEDALVSLVEQIDAEGGKAIPITADLALLDEAGAESIREAIIKAMATPSILINAAGMFGPFRLIKDGGASEWIQTMQVNSIAPYLFMQSLVGGMIELGWGRIVNLTSAASLHAPGPFNSAYATSKAALNHTTRHLAAEISGSGVTANVIHPGEVKTEMWADIKALSKDAGAAGDKYANWAKWVEATGGDDPEKPADLVMDLMSDNANSISGEFRWIKDGLQAPIPSWNS